MQIFMAIQDTAPMPDWLDTYEHPFAANYFETQYGKMHYIDEGRGEIILFVHGTPTWSFLYRNYIKTLSKTHRCLAIDHLGFGLSDKPSDFYGSPQLHSQNLTAFISHLELKDVTLVVHDFGGPIGLSYAVENPNNISKIILFNTWLWDTGDDRDAQKVNKILHSWLGKFIYLNTRFSPNILLKKAFYNKSKLSRKIHRHYWMPFPDIGSRHGLLNMGQSLIGSSYWYQYLWDKMDRIKDKPFLILWGVRDTFIKENNLSRWAGILTNTKCHTFNAGHFVQEEKCAESLKNIQAWLQETIG